VIAFAPILFGLLSVTLTRKLGLGVRDVLQNPVAHLVDAASKRRFLTISTSLFGERSIQVSVLI